MRRLGRALRLVPISKIAMNFYLNISASYGLTAPRLSFPIAIYKTILSFSMK